MYLSSWVCLIMKIPTLRRLSHLLLIFILGGCTSVATTAPEGLDFTVLIFSKTAGYRHASIPDGIAAIQDLAAENNFAVDTSEDATIFNETSLASYDIVVFLNTTGDILDESQQAVFENFIANGGGFVGVHSATDTEYDWPWYGSLVGAYFDGHPPIQEAIVQRQDTLHPSTIGLPDIWQRTDEWYNFRDGPGPTSTILLTVDESSYSGGTMGEEHPLAWYHTVGNGRAWYTAMGHTSATYQEPLFRAHLLGGILWAAGMDFASSEIVYMPVIMK
jgi:type 1 glutamine amidotransferase